MVKLRVAARVIPEDDYLADLARPSHKPLPNERRLLVLVRDPYQWQIGTLALEIQRAYRSCYSHDLPTIKYLKDSEDDCDLDPQLYVSDLLLDEGRAAREANDQRVTIKVILEQGRAVREGSVAVGSSLVDPRFQTQLQTTARPPVPRFPDLATTLGKRSQELESSTSLSKATKRPRQVDILQTQREESLVSSIEHDGPGAPVDIVEATQPLQLSWPRENQALQQSLQEVKAESPTYWKSWQDVPAASTDELEELEGQPEGFPTQRRHLNGTRRSTALRELNGVHPVLAQRASLQRLEDSQAPMTPPSETSHQRSASARRSFAGRQQATGPSPQRSSASASRFKPPVRKDIYDFPDSDIDDSQMSPNSRMNNAHTNTSSDRLSRIENQKSPELGGDAAKRFSLSQAIDALDNESVFNDSAPLADGLDQSFLPVLRDASTTAHVRHGIYEDPEPDTTVMQKGTDANGITIVSSPTDDDQEKENRPLQPSHAQTIHQTSNGVSASQQTPHPSLPSPSIVGDVIGGQIPGSGTKRRRVRRKKDKSDAHSIDGSSSNDQGSERQFTTRPATSFNRKSANERETPSLDSPGEQLSQSLKESARKSSHTQALKKNIDVQDLGVSSPSAKIAPDKVAATVASTGLGATTSDTPASGKDGQLASSRLVKRRQKVAQNNAEVPEPSITIEQAEEAISPPNGPVRPLPNWGSGSVVSDKPASPPQNHAQFLTVDSGKDSRKSPSAPAGLTEEEIQVVRSREGMTQQQYEEEKKKRLLETRKQSVEQRKKEEASRRESSGKFSASKAVLSNPEASSSSKANESNKSPLTSMAPAPGKAKMPTSDAGSAAAKSTTSTKKAVASKGDSVAAASKTPSKIPSKTPTKTSSVKSATTSKSAKASAPAKKQDKSAAKSAAVPKTTKPAPKPASRPTLSTIRGAQSLKALHQVMKSAQETATSTATTSRASSRPNNIRSALNSTSDDDSDDAESSDDESDSEPETKKPPVQQKKTSAGKAAVPAPKTPTSKPPAKKPESRRVEVDDETSSEDEDSDDDDDDDEDEYERMQTEAARLMKIADSQRAKSASVRPGASQSSLGAPATPKGQPDPSIRNVSVDPSSSDDDDDSAL